MSAKLARGVGSKPILSHPSINPLLHTSAFGKILENIMKNGAFAPEEQMFHFTLYFQNYWNVKIIFWKIFENLNY